jgi:probable rRNA maturation factor
MIFLDPELEPEPAPAADTVSRAAVRRNRMPTLRTLVRFLSEAQRAVRLRGQVTVLLTTDTAIRRLNRQFRGKNKATDVLSFPAGGPAAGGIAGDLAISVPTARRQAADQGHALVVELKVLMLHGLLHLAGYDHETDTGQMARRERLLRSKLGLPLGLIERVEGAAPAKKSRRTAGARP